jgi:glutamine amidotransferase
MRIAVIKYNAGNIQSVRYALERLSVDFLVTDDPEEIRGADKVIFPGVGEASTTMAFLRQKKMDQLIVNLKQPVLGICLGMQLMCRHSDENNTTCLGIFGETVRKFTPANDLKVPHIGWNSLLRVSGWLSQELENQFVYFVHSYFVPLNEHTVAQTEYGSPFSAAMKKDNFYAVQFHPEKSAAAGERVLQSFLSV